MAPRHGRRVWRHVTGGECGATSREESVEPHHWRRVWSHITGGECGATSREESVEPHHGRRVWRHLMGGECGATSWEESVEPRHGRGVRRHLMGGECGATSREESEEPGDEPRVPHAVAEPRVEEPLHALHDAPPHLERDLRERRRSVSSVSFVVCWRMLSLCPGEFRACSEQHPREHTACPGGCLVGLREGTCPTYQGNAHVFPETEHPRCPRAPGETPHTYPQGPPHKPPGDTTLSPGATPYVPGEDPIRPSGCPTFPEGCSTPRGDTPHALGNTPHVGHSRVDAPHAPRGTHLLVLGLRLLGPGGAAEETRGRRDAALHLRLPRTRIEGGVNAQRKTTEFSAEELDAVPTDLDRLVAGRCGRQRFDVRRRDRPVPPRLRRPPPRRHRLPPAGAGPAALPVRRPGPGRRPPPRGLGPAARLPPRGVGQGHLGELRQLQQPEQQRYPRKPDDLRSII